MKQFLIALILLTCFLSASAAELSCDCSTDTITHSQAYDNHEANDDQGNDHCQQTCTQCHFAAVIPRFFHLKPESTFVQLSFLAPTENSQEVTALLYRPPIA